MTLTVAHARTLLALWRSALDFDRFDVLSFDCYGTLIDFEAGVLAALRPILARHGVALADDALLEVYGALKLPVERGPFRPFREVLLRTMERFGQRFGFAPTPGERTALAESLADWTRSRTTSRRSPSSGGISARQPSRTSTTTCSRGARGSSARRSRRSSPRGRPGTTSGCPTTSTTCSHASAAPRGACSTPTRASATTSGGRGAAVAQCRARLGDQHDRQRGCVHTSVSGVRRRYPSCPHPGAIQSLARLVRTAAKFSVWARGVQHPRPDRAKK